MSTKRIRAGQETLASEHSATTVQVRPACVLVSEVQVPSRECASFWPRATGSVLLCSIGFRRVRGKETLVSCSRGTTACRVDSGVRGESRCGSGVASSWRTRATTAASDAGRSGSGSGRCPTLPVSDMGISGGVGTGASATRAGAGSRGPKKASIGPAGEGASAKCSGGGSAGATKSTIGAAGASAKRSGPGRTWAAKSGTAAGSAGAVVVSACAAGPSEALLARSCGSNRTGAFAEFSSTVVARLPVGQSATASTDSRRNPATTAPRRTVPPPTSSRRDAPASLRWRVSSVGSILSSWPLMGVAGTVSAAAAAGLLSARLARRSHFSATWTQASRCLGNSAASSALARAAAARSRK